MDDDEDLYRALRGRLLGIAYRLLGSAAEAEDVVQDAFVRLVGARRAGGIASPAGFLVTVTTRIGIDRLRSARVRREQYPGQWLPEPVSDLPEDDPAGRAVFVVRDVFECDYEEIGRIVDRSPAACREIALRERRHVAERRKRFSEADATARSS